MAAPMALASAPSSSLCLCLALLSAALAPAAPQEAAKKKAPAPAAGESPLDRALAEVKLTRESAAFDPDDMALYGGGAFRLPWFTALHNSPFKIPSAARYARARSVESARSFAASFSAAATRTGFEVRRGLLGDPVEAARKRAAEPSALAKALRALGGEIDDAAADALPKELAEPLALLLFAAKDAERWRDRAIRAMGPDAEPNSLYVGAASPLLGAPGGPTEAMLEKFDFRYLYAGAADLAFAVDAAVEKLRVFTGEARFAADTPLGRVIVNGRGDDTIEPGPAVLVAIDLGGNDTHRIGGANASAANPVSILLDLAGDDRYEASDSVVASQGGGRLGYAFLLDVAGKDTYVAPRAAQGFGALGVGLLRDEAGDDTYRVSEVGQGAAVFGVGVLVDLAGTDKYECLRYSQGFGYTLGSGALVDLDGNDEYVADDTNITSPSPQAPDHNGSLSQGFGFGVRGDYTDGHSWSGGVGVLVDEKGDDEYSCGVFGQGCGYWYGAGLLLDGGGKDSYRGVWYVQGSGAHFAVGALWDAAGDDRYVATMNMAQGAGHDFSTGFLVDDAGNDVHDAPNLSLGGGNDNGIGIFLDRAGDDEYTTRGVTLGRGAIGARGALRERLLCLGVFLDFGGKDKYVVDGKESAFAKDKKTWTQPGTNAALPSPAEKGVGLDGEHPAGTVIDP